MPTPSIRYIDGSYALQLLPANPGQAQQLIGRLEHVPSGRRHDFGDGAALLALLALEQGLVSSAGAPALQR